MKINEICLLKARDIRSWVDKRKYPIAISVAIIAIVLVLVLAASDIGPKQRASLCGSKPTSTITTKLVLAHYMIQYTDYGADVNSYSREMHTASEGGVDGFALNCGHDYDNYATQISNFFQAAAQQTDLVSYSSSSFKVTLSLDTDSFIAQYGLEGSISPMVKFVQRYLSRPSYLLHYQSHFPIITTFGGADVDWSEFKRQLGAPCHLIVNYFTNPVESASLDAIDGLFSWPPQGSSIHDSFDSSLMEAAETLRKEFMGYVTFAFSTHQPNKNFAFSRYDIVNRWESIIAKNISSVELVSWNDFTESTNFFDPVAESTSVGSSTITSKSHAGFWDLTKHYIQRYKIGNEPCVDGERIYIWYRTHPRDAVASADPLPRT